MNGRRRIHGPRATVTVIGCALLLLAASAGLYADADSYQRGTRALDQRDWAEAAEAFAEEARAKGDRADAALYWRAYALGKLERVGVALGALEKLEDLYPDSRWIDDAEELRAELTGSASVRDEKEELRLMALFSLTHSDPERAVTYLETFLDADNSLDGKEQALFLALQTGSAEALELVASIAKGVSEPELRVAAVRATGMMGSSTSEEILAEIYRTTNDAEIKRAVLDAYLVSGSTGRMTELARDRSDPEMRRKALEMLGMMGAMDMLAELYSSEKDLETRAAIIRGMSIGGGSRHLEEIAASSADPVLRAEAIQGLGIAGGSSPEFMIEIYENERESEIKAAALQALFMAGEVDALIALARDEDHSELKRQIVQMLALTGSETATAYLMELLDE